jgi:serine/threonine protein kinase
MELAEYGDVLSFFDNFKDVQWPWKLKMAYDISLGMNYLHTQQRPIIHGDLKAKNVLVAKNFVTKISDFGLSVWKQFTFETTKLTGVKGGTVTHIPPENWKDINKKRTDKYDVYSFGILLWELLAFPKRPFDQADCHFIRTAVINNERPLLRDISGVKTEFLRQIVEKCWHQDPTIRPTFMELKGQLSEHVSGFQSDVDEARRKLKQKDFGSTNVPALSRCYQEYVQTNPDAGKQVCDNSTQLNLVSQPFSDQECKTRYALGGSGSGTLVSGNLDVEPYGQHSFDSKDGLQLSVVQETPEEDQEARTASSLSDTDGTGVQSSATVTTGTPVQPSTVVECFTVREFLSWLGREEWAVQFYYDTKDHLVHIAVRSTDENGESQTENSTTCQDPTTVCTG